MPGLAPGARILDVGAGSGILALAALRLGPGSAVAFDLDPLAAAASRENAVANGLAGRLEVFMGPLEALRPTPFDLVLANLLKTELLPLVEGIAALHRPGWARRLLGPARRTSARPWRRPCARRACGCSTRASARMRAASAGSLSS